MYVRLSNNINPNAPIWPGNIPFSADMVSSISEGGDANTYMLHLFNHNGTHLDAPNHFINDGLKITELSLYTFIYEKPILIEIQKSFGGVITPDDLKPYYNEIKKSDLLMIRTGFHNQRTIAPNRYISEGPKFSSEASMYIMDHFQLKAIALDWISLASPLDFEDGYESHRIMLGKYHNHFTCIIEDCNFEKIKDGVVKRVFAMPLFIEGIDSCQVTMLAELRD